MPTRRFQLTLGLSVATLPLVGGTAHGMVPPEAAQTSPARPGLTVLHDNGLPDAVNGYSNATEAVFGAHRTLLDDFVVPTGETWTLEQFEWRNLSLFPAPVGTWAEIALWTGSDGAPDTPFRLLEILDYNEIQTGNQYFSGEETLSWVDFESVELTGGHYWIEGTIVSTENNFWLTASPIQHSECWVNYDDLGGLQRGNDIFGTPADLSWRLLGQRDAQGSGACCFPSGNCLAMTVFECDARGGIFQGIDVLCDITVCGAPGACCFLDNTCVEQSEAFCLLEGGTYAGLAVPCSEALCIACGEFGPPVEYAGDFQSAVALADLDGDLDLDMATVRLEGLSIFLNQGNGTFPPPLLYFVDGARLVALADLDGDLDVDVAVTGRSQPVTVLRNHGDGTFGTGEVYESASGPSFIALPDLNGDLVPDMVVADDGHNVISVWMNDGRGVFGPRTDYASGDGPTTGAVGDLDGDLDVDLAIPHQSDSTVSVFFNNGDGTFAPRIDHDVDGRPSSVAAVDIDGDLDLDLASPNGAEIVVLRNDGTGTFVEEGTIESRFARKIAAADLDGDLDVDFVVSDLGSPEGQVAVLLNEGDGTFGPQDEYPVGQSLNAPAIGDLDGDSSPDLAVPSRAVVIRFSECCREDLDGSGAVDFADILAILAAWGDAGGPEDLDGSGTVEFGDVLVVLAAWGDCV